MEADERGAADAVDVDAHMSDDVPDNQRTQVDERAMRMEQERKAAANGSVAGGDFAGPSGLVILQELQDLRKDMSLVSTLSLTAIWLGCIIIGYSVFQVAKLKQEVDGGE